MATQTWDSSEAPALPSDVRMMNATALLFGIVAVALVAATAVLWIARQPFFAIRSIAIEGDVGRNSVSTIRANAAPKLAGNFLTIDLAAARRAF